MCRTNIEKITVAFRGHQEVNSTDAERWHLIHAFFKEKMTYKRKNPCEYSVRFATHTHTHTHLDHVHTTKETKTFQI